MSEEKRLQFSSQLAFVEQEEIAVVLSEKETLALYKKSQNSEHSFDTLNEVYRRGYLSWDLHLNESPEQTAFNRVNSFIAGGVASQLDEDLINELSPQLIGKVSNARTIGGNPSKTEVAAATLDRAAKNAWIKSKVGVIKKDKINEKKPGLWDNIHAKRARIKAGSGERMRKPGSKGAPTDASIKASQTEDTDPCWKNYKQVGTKTKNGREVPNCVPKEEYTGAEKVSKNMEDPSSRFVGTTELTNVYKKMTPGYSVKEVVKRVVKEAIEEKWSDSKHKSPSGGLTQAGVNAYRRENPGSKLKTAVTTKPSKLKKGSKAANRRKSFCARMGGMKKRLTSAKTANDPDSRINKSLRKWNC
jgi:hypothetical protein